MIIKVLRMFILKSPLLTTLRYKLFNFYNKIVAQKIGWCPLFCLNLTYTELNKIPWQLLSSIKC
jgi:hypothetical protein